MHVDRAEWRSRLEPLLLKYLLHNPRHDAAVCGRRRVVARCRPHRERLARARLSVRKHCRVVSGKNAVEQGQDARLVDLVLQPSVAADSTTGSTRWQEKG